MNRRITLLIMVIAMMIGGLSACALYRFGAPYTRAVNLVVPVKEIAPIATMDNVERMMMRRSCDVVAMRVILRR
jgi:hypothetical protein